MVDDVTLDADGLARPTVFPRRLPTPSRARLSRRATQIFRVGTRNFASLIWKTARHRRVPDDEFAAPLRHTFEELGGTFMKFGQLVGSAPSMFGDAVAQEFRSCLDTGAPVPIDKIRNVIEESLGGPMEATFAAFEEEPIGRASIAVVHRARLHDGRDVAVKVLRPGIELQVATDLDLFEPLLKMAARHTGDANAGSLLQMFDGFRIQIGEELDLRNELRAMVNYRQLLDQVDLPLVMVPRPHPELQRHEGAGHGVPRRRAGRRPGPHHRVRLRPGPGRRPAGQGVPHDRSPLGHVPRRCPRRQPAAHARRPDRRDRLGHRRPPRPGQLLLLPPAVRGGAGRRHGVEGHRRPHHRELRAGDPRGTEDERRGDHHLRPGDHRTRRDRSVRSGQSRPRW